jgi:hypothetical protein
MIKMIIITIGIIEITTTMIEKITTIIIQKRGSKARALVHLAARICVNV